MIRDNHKGEHLEDEMKKEPMSNEIGAIDKEKEPGMDSEQKRIGEKKEADVLMEEEVAEEAGEGDDPKSGIKCSRCTKKGHVPARCTNDIYCVICDSNEHMNHRCPMLKQPQPVAHVVGYVVHGL